MCNKKINRKTNKKQKINRQKKKEKHIYKKNNKYISINIRDNLIDELIEYLKHKKFKLFAEGEGNDYFELQLDFEGPNNRIKSCISQLNFKYKNQINISIGKY